MTQITQAEWDFVPIIQFKEKYSCNTLDINVQPTVCN